MGYLALDKMREINRIKYGIDGPANPQPFETVRLWEGDGKGDEPVFQPISELERHVTHFIRETCTNLRFLKDEEHAELQDLDGTSLRKGQIPYNMEMDLDRRCLEVAIHRFLESGVAKDAFDVYFCYLEMFVGEYGQTKKMIEMLSEFETNASSLLMKHRDHYSHSVYVFLIGLAFYDESSCFREAYKKKYAALLEREGLDRENEQDVAGHFLKYWGLTSLFHDIGYPFELSFEQVKSYFGDTISGVPFVKFHMNSYQIKTDERDIRKLQKLLPGQNLTGDLNEYLAKAMFLMFGDDYQNGQSDYEKYLYTVLNEKPEYPEKFNGYIDHAYFSTILLIHNLMRILDEDELNEMYTNAFVAILLHNSLYKFSITNIKSNFNENRHFNLNRSPLAYLLMLCDELQCWDRTSYGQKSRGEVHPFSCELSFEGDRIRASYLFDSSYADASQTELKEHYRTVKGTYKKLAPDAEGSCEFLKDIESIISINGDTSFGESNTIVLETGRAFRQDNRFHSAYLSSSNFIHLYKFAVMVHQMNHIEEITGEEMDEKFNVMSLEYKISHISRAKKFARILSEVGCFYSDKPMDFDIVTQFGDELNTVMGPIEHERWCFEHWIMGWRFGSDYKKIAEETGRSETILRECTKTHVDMPETEGSGYTKQLGIAHFEKLTEAEGHAADSREKDTRSMNNLLKVLSEEDGIKVYRLSKRTQ